MNMSNNNDDDDDEGQQTLARRMASFSNRRTFLDAPDISTDPSQRLLCPLLLRYPQSDERGREKEMPFLSFVRSSRATTSGRISSRRRRRSVCACRVVSPDILLRGTRRKRNNGRNDRRVQSNEIEKGKENAEKIDETLKKKKKKR